MSELTFLKQSNGLYEAHYINGQWAIFRNVSKVDMLKKNVGVLYNKYRCE